MMFCRQLELDVYKLFEYRHTDVGWTKQIPSVIWTLETQTHNIVQHTVSQNRSRFLFDYNSNMTKLNSRHGKMKLFLTMYILRN